METNNQNGQRLREVQRRPQAERRSASAAGTPRSNQERNRVQRDSREEKRPAAVSREKTASTEKRRVNQEAVDAIKAKKRKKWIIRLSVIAGVLILCILGFLLTYRVFYDVPLDRESTKKVEITIPEGGATDDEVADMLIEGGCIEDKGLYKIRCKLYEAEYVPGTYKVSPSYTTEKIINVLSGYDYSDGLMDE